MLTTTDILNKCHFSVRVLAQTLLFTALRCTELKILGESCHVETTNRGFIVYPRVEEDKYPGDTICIESRYYGQHRDMHHECFLVKIGWSNEVPEIIEITDTCTSSNQLSLNARNLNIRVDEAFYTTSKVLTQESRFHVPHDILCKYDAGKIEKSELVKIAQRIKKGVLEKEAISIASLQAKVDSLQGQLGEIKNWLQDSRVIIKNREDTISTLQKELNTTEKVIRARTATISNLHQALEDLHKEASSLVSGCDAWDNILFGKSMPVDTFNAQGRLQVVLDRIDGLDSLGDYSNTCV